MAAHSDVLWFIDRSWSVAEAELAPAAQLLQSDARLAAVLVFGPDDALPARCWRELPPALAALVRPWPQSRPLCVRKSAWEESGRFREVEEPQWEWVVRIALDARRIAATTIDLTGGISLSASDDLPPLTPGSPGRKRNWLRERIATIAPEDLTGTVASRPDSVAFKAGLLGLADWLDDSHSHSQSIEGEGRHHAGDYWHGIMHRREPDDSNAKYWFRRVGRHPVFDELAPEAGRILAACPSADADCWRQRLGTPSGWDAFAFVDLCSHCRGTDDKPLETAARRIQLAEMLLLLIHTYRDAVGESP